MNVISCSTVSGPPTPLGHSAYEFRVPSSNIAPLSLSYGPEVKVTALPRIASGFLLVWSRALPSNFTNNNGDGYLSNPCIATNRVNKGYVRKSNVCRQYPIAKSNSLSRAIFLPAVLFEYFCNHTSTNTNYKQAQIFHSEWMKSYWVPSKPYSSHIRLVRNLASWTIICNDPEQLRTFVTQSSYSLYYLLVIHPLQGHSFGDVNEVWINLNQ